MSPESIRQTAVDKPAARTPKVGDLVYIRARIQARVVDVHRIEFLNEALEPHECKVELPTYYIETCDRKGMVTTRSDFLAVRADHMISVEDMRRATRGET
jgi:hypothetical protein